MPAFASVRPVLVALLALASAAGSRAQDLSQPGPLTPAQRDVTVVRAGGSTFTATVHYPALGTASGSPVDAGNGPYPIIAFGHGFVTPVTQYASTCAHLASWGFVVLLPQTQGSLFPSHSAFADDLVSALDWMGAQAGAAGSPWAGAVDPARRGVMGHSMGGGCALLAADRDPSIRVAVPFSAAETNPSSTSACLGVGVATRIVVGSQDTIVPPTTNAPMFANLRGPAQLVSIAGGFHCGFIDGSIAFCDSGSISRAQQLAIVRRESAEFLLLYLRGDASRWDAVWGPPGAADGVTQQARQTPDLDGNGRVDGSDLGILLADWGLPGRGDLDGDGTVTGGDLGQLLAAWTP
jgi:predicted dienelactone hydrolase